MKLEPCIILKTSPILSCNILQYNFVHIESLYLARRKIKIFWLKIWLCIPVLARKRLVYERQFARAPLSARGTDLIYLQMHVRSKIYVSQLESFLLLKHVKSLILIHTYFDRNTLCTNKGSVIHTFLIGMPFVLINEVRYTLFLIGMFCVLIKEV